MRHRHDSRGRRARIRAIGLGGCALAATVAAAGLVLHFLAAPAGDGPGRYKLGPGRSTVGPEQYTVGPDPIALTQPGDELLGRAVPAGDADTNGMFAPQMAWPVIPIHAALQPNGHLITYGTPLNRAEQGGLVYDDWNPALGTADAGHTLTPSMEAYNAFCNALQTLPDGRVLMVGGNSTNSTMYFDARAGAESMGPGLNRSRWYASVMRLTDDRILVLGGGNFYNTGAFLKPDDNSGVATTPEIGDGRGAWTLLSGADSATAFGARDNRWWYPRAFNAPDGTVFGVSGNQMWRLSAAGAGSVTSLGVIPSAIGVSGAAVMYAPGKILLAGGGQAFNEDRVTATNAATTLDIRRAKPVVTRVRPMANRRNWLTLTVLPTGEVLANGGTIVGTEAGAGNAVYAAEIWNPATGTWRTAASAKRIRTYHSTSVLLPSGAVFTGGGGVPGPEDNLNAEIYYPPSLFTRNPATGAVAWASRPTITSLSGSLAWGGTIHLGLGDARTIGSVSLISAGKVSHSVNQDQRRIPLTFTQNGAEVTAVDFSEGMLAEARRKPGAEALRFIAHDLHTPLPFADGAFDLVTGFSAFQFAADPVAAVREAARVARGGRVVVAVFGPREANESDVYLSALAALLPTPPPGAPGPYVLSADGALEALADRAGLTAQAVREVACPWVYPDRATALRGLLASGPAVRAAELAGEEAVRDAILSAIAPFRVPGGGYRLTNTFRYLVAAHA